jgi:hypothetical protein
MRLLHDLAKTHALFDDPNLVSRAGLVPVMALAQRCGLGDLAAGHVRTALPAGGNAELKVACLVAGMIAGADSIDDMDVLRHGAMAHLFGGVRAPSTLRSFLRSFTWGSTQGSGWLWHQYLTTGWSARACLPRPAQRSLRGIGQDAEFVPSGSARVIQPLPSRRR